MNNNYDTDFDRQMLDIQTFTTLAATIHGAMLWDLIICIPAEAKYIFWPDLLALLRRGRMPSLTSCLLFISRMLVIPMVSLGKVLTMGQPSDCKAVFRATLLLYSIGVANATAVFVVRTLAIRSSRWPLSIFLWSLWALQTSGWLYWASRPKLDNVARLNSYTTTCQHMSDNPSWTWVMFVAFGLFDLLILILTLDLYIRHFGNLPFTFKSWRQRDKDVSEQFFEDTVLYFALSLTVSILEIAWLLSHLHRYFYTALMGPVQVWLTLIISPRVIRNIKLHNARNAVTMIDPNSIKTLALSTTKSSTMEGRHDTFQFDTSVLERVNAADHFDPPAHIQSKNYASSQSPQS